MKDKYQELQSKVLSSVEVTEKKNNNLPNFHQLVKLKYIKLGYHYLITNFIYLILIPFLILSLVHLSKIGVNDLRELWNQLQYNIVTVVQCSSLLGFLLGIYFMTQPRPVYLVDFALHKGRDDQKCPHELFMERSRLTGFFNEQTVTFQKKIMERSGLGQLTYMPDALFNIPPNPCMAEARKEVEAVVFGAVDQVLAKTGVKPKDIGILVVNSSFLNPIPSLSAMIVNHYKLRSNIKSFNLGGMGCSAGIISVDLAKKLLQVGYVFVRCLDYGV